jgi:hypothetical protein
VVALAGIDQRYKRTGVGQRGDFVVLALRRFSNSRKRW